MVFAIFVGSIDFITGASNRTALTTSKVLIVLPLRISFRRNIPNQICYSCLAASNGWHFV